jgi:hypothetical protein
VSIALRDPVSGAIVIAIVRLCVIVNFDVEFQARHGVEDIRVMDANWSCRSPSWSPQTESRSGRRADRFMQVLRPQAQELPDWCFPGSDGNHRSRILARSAIVARFGI